MESLSKHDNAIRSFPNVILWQLSYPWILFRLRLFEKVVEATFGHVLSANNEEVISQFGVPFTTIMSIFHIFMTPKIHIFLQHIPQVIRMTQMRLGLFSEEVVQEQHKHIFLIL